jgi:hypothetical protein
METATETYQHNRELTTTEVKIAIAQIEDRLMRVAKAQDELYKLSENLETELEIENLKTSLRYKYDIPKEVHLWMEEGENRTFLLQAKKHIASFVKGELDELTFSDLYFFFEEFEECDYPWILIEKPAGFYGAGGSECCIDELLPELQSIGCRSRIKNKRLPKICGYFSAQ